MSKQKNRRLTALDIELAVSEFFGIKKNLIIPNLSWSFFAHELDLFVLTQNSFGYEVEIKVSVADLKKDLTKTHGHKDSKIKRLYYAIPGHLLNKSEIIPSHAGILLVSEKSVIENFPTPHEVVSYHTEIIKEPEGTSSYKFTEAERIELYRLMAMRVWTGKKQLQKMKLKLAAK